MNLPLFAQVTPTQSPQPGDWFQNNYGWVILGIVVLLVAIFLVVIFLSFVRLWIQSFLTGARISIWDLVGMKLRNVDYGMIVRQKIALVQAGVKISTQDLEAHYLARGNVPKTAAAVIAAHKAKMELPWKDAAAIDLAGRDVLDAVRTSVNPKVIDCPNTRDLAESKDRSCTVNSCSRGLRSPTSCAPRA